MNEATKRLLGEELEPGFRKPAPAPLRVVQRFLNTWNHEFPPDWDRLGSGSSATQWLTSAGLLPDGDHLDDGGAARLRAAREALRTFVEGDELGARVLNQASDARAVILVEADGRIRLQPIAGGAAGALTQVLARVHDSQLTGTWGRLKGCRQCGWAFYDHSKNRSGTWCAMSICGNRTKNQAYRRRRTASE